MQQTVKDGQRSLKLERRAWIGPIDVVVNDLAVGTIFQPVVRMKNNGASPAVDVQDGYWFENPLSGQMPNLKDVWDRSRKNGQMLSKSVIQPGATVLLRIPSSEDGRTPMNEVTFNAITSGERVSYIFGETRYGDIFGDNHWTRWCYRYDPLKKTYALCE